MMLAAMKRLRVLLLGTMRRLLGRGAVVPAPSPETAAGRLTHIARRFIVGTSLLLMLLGSIAAGQLQDELGRANTAVSAAAMAARQPALALRLAQLNVSTPDAGELSAFDSTLAQLEHEQAALIAANTAAAPPELALRTLYFGPGYGLKARLDDLFALAHRLRQNPEDDNAVALLAAMRREIVEQVADRLTSAAEWSREVAVGDMDRLHVHLRLAALAIVLVPLLVLLACVPVDRRLRRILSLLEWLAARDTLTGALTHGAFTSRLHQLLKRANTDSGVGVVVLDLDDFQALNATHGDAAGDVALRAAGQRLRRAAGPQALVARLGSDSFGVAIPNLTGGHVTLARAAIGLTAALRGPVPFGGHLLNIAASGGTALAPQDSANRNELLRMAGVAMREAKREMKGSIQAFRTDDNTAQMRREAVLRALTEGDLTGVVPWLQPLVQCGDMMPVRFEVLARWRHPTLGWVPPAEFLPIAEAVGRLPLLSAHVRNLAFMTLVELHRQLDTVPILQATNHRRPGIAINIAPSEIAVRGMLPAMEAALDEAGLEFGMLTIEVNEEMLVGGADETAHGRLQELRRRGVRLNLDNFGSGFANLSHLHHFQVDGLKIARSFIGAIGQDSRAEAILHGVVGLGRGLGVEMIGEGVETQEQLDFVRQAGFDVAQGYFIAKPMPAEDIPAWIASLRMSQAVLG